MSVLQSVSGQLFCSTMLAVEQPAHNPRVMNIPRKYGVWTLEPSVRHRGKA